MAKTKYYAVAKGLCPGIYTSWDDCKREVSGYPGAIFKSFSTLPEAEEFLKRYAPTDYEKYKGKTVSKKTKPKKPTMPSESVTIYVDGSYDVKTQVYGYAAIVIDEKGNIIEKISGAGNQKELAALRNVTGEIFASMEAVEYALKNNYKKALICYDYQGIECWVTGKWRAKTELTSNYAIKMQEYSKNIEIKFKKIAAHTGEKYNEMTDKLAKAAVKSYLRG